MKQIVIDGKVFELKSSSEGSRNRCVVVVDRGWMWVGDVTRENGRILLQRAKHLFNFKEIGFVGVLDNPLSDKVDLREANHIIDIPESAELFCVHVDDDWGI